MENRALIEKLRESFIGNDHKEFMFVSIGNFRPEKSGQSYYLENMSFIEDLQKLNRIDADAEWRLAVDQELTAQSSNKKHYQILQSVLMNDYNATICFRISLSSLDPKETIRRSQYSSGPNYRFVHWCSKSAMPLSSVPSGTSPG
jgi:hypothetical protein